MVPSSKLLNPVQEGFVACKDLRSLLGLGSGLGAVHEIEEAGQRLGWCLLHPGLNRVCLGAGVPWKGLLT
jgi:hypothetical protein